jgi:hypothetical protein
MRIDSTKTKMQANPKHSVKERMGRSQVKGKKKGKRVFVDTTKTAGW